MAVHLARTCQVLRCCRNLLLHKHGLSTARAPLIFRKSYAKCLTKMETRPNTCGLLNSCLSYERPSSFVVQPRSLNTTTVLFKKHDKIEDVEKVNIYFSDDTFICEMEFLVLKKFGKIHNKFTFEQVSHTDLDKNRKGFKIVPVVAKLAKHTKEHSDKDKEISKKGHAKVKSMTFNSTERDVTLKLDKIIEMLLAGNNVQVIFPDKMKHMAEVENKIHKACKGFTTIGKQTSSGTKTNILIQLKQVDKEVIHRVLKKIHDKEKTTIDALQDLAETMKKYETT